MFVGALCALTAASILWIVSLVSGFENAQVVFTREDGIYSFEAAGYGCEFTRDDILSVTLTDKMPDDKFTRTNGGSGKDYRIFPWKRNRKYDVFNRRLHRYSKNRIKGYDCFCQLSGRKNGRILVPGIRK